MNKQITIADVLDDLEEPIGPGDYVQHSSRPGDPLLVVSLLFKSLLGNDCIKVKDSKQIVYQVLLKYLTRI